jgi:hypothetical protein
MGLEEKMTESALREIRNKGSWEKEIVRLQVENAKLQRAFDRAITALAERDCRTPDNVCAEYGNDCKLCLHEWLMRDGD